MTTVLAYSDIFLQHQTAPHPECPERLRAIIDKLQQNGMFSQLTIPTELIAPDPWIRTIHSPDYIQRVEDACKSNQFYIDSPDSVISPDSFQVARQAVSYALSAAYMIMSDQAANGFCPLRPPGHHAEHNRSMGFCLFNNIAITTRYLQNHHNLQKILILDWDVHHGNGTQHSFENDPTIFFCSIHQHPATLYPGTGWAHETGAGPGQGFTLNLPLEPGSHNDDCLDVFHKKFLPAADNFAPDFVLISAGFDAHQLDPLAQLNFDETCYIVMTKEMKKFAEKHCRGRLMSLLEGGYHLDALSNSVAGHVGVLLS